MRREVWESRTGGALAVAGVLFFVAYSVVVLWVDAPEVVRALLLGVLGLAWLAFLVDIVARIVLEPRGGRLRFALRHPIELLSVVLPPVRAVVAVRRLRDLPGLHGPAGWAVRTRLVASAVAYSVVFVYMIALATLWVERDAPGATITGFGDAVWWAVVTLATVGYGDTYPVTALGRVYAVLLMIGGIAILGTASATVISYISEQIRPPRDAPSRRAGDDAPDADGRDAAAR